MVLFTPYSGVPPGTYRYARTGVEYMVASRHSSNWCSPDANGSWLTSSYYFGQTVPKTTAVVMLLPPEELLLLF